MPAEPSEFRRNIHHRDGPGAKKGFNLGLVLAAARDTARCYAGLAKNGGRIREREESVGCESGSFQLMPAFRRPARRYSRGLYGGWPSSRTQKGAVLRQSHFIAAMIRAEGGRPGHDQRKDLVLGKVPASLSAFFNIQDIVRRRLPE